MGDVSFKGLVDGLANLGALRRASNRAEELTNYTPGWSSNGKADAQRHGVTSGLIARQVSPEAASTIGTLREKFQDWVLGQDPRETNMDLGNEAFAIRHAPNFESDDQWINYIMATPTLKKQMDPQFLQWFGESRTKKAQGGLIQMKGAHCGHQ